MKLGRTIIAAFAVSAFAFAGAQGAPAKASAMKRAPQHTMSKADWQKMYDNAAKAFDKMDADKIFSFMAPGFTLTMGGQAMNTDQAKMQMKSWFGMMKTMHCTFKITKVSGNGNMATVVDQFTQGGMSKPNPKTHKSDKYEDKGTETATWVNQGGKWWMKSLVISHDKMTKNGKPFNPSMAPK